MEKSRENKNEAKPKVKIPRIPPHLTPEQKKHFRYFAKLLLPVGLVTEIDGTALAMLAQTWDRYVKASEKYNSVGPVVLSPNKFPIQNPYLAVMNKEGVPPCKFSRTVEEAKANWAMDLTDALYQVSGTLSMTFEGPHGVQGPDYEVGYEGILDTHLIMYRELLRIGLEPGGFRGKAGVPRGNWKE